MKTIENKIARTIVLAVTLMVLFPVFGQNADAVDLNLATRVGENFIKMNTFVKLSGRGGSLQRVQTDKFPNLYIFNADEHGFIIVAGDKRVKPILGFSDEGTFDPNDMAPAAEMIIGSYDYAVDSMVRYNVRATDESIRQAWVDLENGYFEKSFKNNGEQSSYPLIYRPIITTSTFDQGSIAPNDWQNNYNQYCPVYEGPSNNGTFISLKAFTGCGATAMAQMLYFYKKYPKDTDIENKIVNENNVIYSVPAFQGSFLQVYPNLSQSFPGYVHVPLKLKKMGIDVVNHVFEDVNDSGIHWFKYLKWDYSSVRKDEVAKIMYYCGLKIGSNYRVLYNPSTMKLNGDTESGLPDILDVLQESFGFSKAFIKPQIMDLAAWDDTLKKYISHRVPLVYRGTKNSDNSIGHIYIIDGYTTIPLIGTFFHHKLGAGGENDGYYFSSHGNLLGNNASPYPYGQFFLSTVPIKDPEDKCEPNLSCLNVSSKNERDDPATSQIIYESVMKYHEYMDAMINYVSQVIGGAYWQDEEKGMEFWNLFQSLLDNNTGMMSEEGVQQLINQNQFEFVSDGFIRDIAERYNQSVLYWNEGYYTNESLPEGYGGMIEYDTTAMRKAYEAQAYAESLGFSDVRQMYDNAYEILEAEVGNQQTSVCASVTMQFAQKMTMTREAFNGTLQIFNGHESIPMEDILVDFRIEDQQGNDCTNQFQINTLSLDQITGISGDGSLAAQTNGTALVQFIPTKNAAPTEPKVYSFGGSFSFIDPFTGEGLTYPLYPVEITVNPSPDLYVDYFMQRDILGDDALTTDVVEPTVPAELGVIIHNKGTGMAKNVTLETAEPQIIDNERGLAIDFAMYGASFNGTPRQLGLTEIRFGNIGSGQTAVGEWLFTSSLLGHFVSYNAHVIHNSSYGNSDLSLVSHLDIHELIHPFYAYGNLDDGINDFLVNDNPDAYDTPDSIYFSHGGKTSVGVVDDISFDHLVSPSDTIVTLTVVPSRVGWNYGVTDDPGMNQYNIVSCIRNNDNQEIPLNNVWLTFVTIPDGGDPVYENKLHIVDTIPVQQTTTYTLVFEYNPDASYSMAQNMSLSQGWNWWSTYIEQSNIDGLSMLENSLGHKGVTIKSQFDFVQNFYSDYGEDVWFGSLEGLANEQGYMIDVTEDCSVSMAGVRAKPVSHPITINPNWNWIGYPVTSRQSVTSALADYNALPEDLIKSHYEFSVYYNGFGWFPDDLVMTPGEGYFYYSNAPTSQTLTYSTSRGEVLPEKSDKRVWKTNVHAFADNISIVAVVSIDSIEQRDEELELGAFVNGECRGSARLKHFGPLDRYYAVLSVAGQEGDKVEFGFINKDKGQGSMVSENHITFVRNGIMGSLGTPYVVSFNTLKDEAQEGSMVLFPNPVERNKTFSLDIPKNDMLKELVIVDMLGEEVLRKTGALKSNEITGLPVAGIYVVKAITESGNVYHGRLIVK